MQTDKYVLLIHQVSLQMVLPQLPFDDDVVQNNHAHIDEQYYHIHRQ